MASPNNQTTLETITGRFINLVDPNPSDICLIDIAWSLSRLARFNGHTINTIPYSVAQHSIVVANESANLAAKYYQDQFQGYVLTPPEVARWKLIGLTHDASEAYTGDVSGPLKKIPEFRPIIKTIEKKIQDAILEALGLLPLNDIEEQIVKAADVLAQRIEAYNFMVSRGQNWSNSPEVSILKLQEFEMPLNSSIVYERFLEMFNTEKSKFDYMQ